VLRFIVNHLQTCMTLHILTRRVDISINPSIDFWSCWKYASDLTGHLGGVEYRRQTNVVVAFLAWIMMMIIYQQTNVRCHSFFPSGVGAPGATSSNLTRGLQSTRGRGPVGSLLIYRGQRMNVRENCAEPHGHQRRKRTHRKRAQWAARSGVQPIK